MHKDYSKFLHVFASDAGLSCLWTALDERYPAASIELDLSIGLLPQNFSLEEYHRCKQAEYKDWGDGRSLIVFGADLNKYEGIVVWHSCYISEAILFAMFCSNFNGNLLHCDVSKKFPGKRITDLSQQEVKSCLDYIRPVSSTQKKSFASKYQALPHDIPCIKNYFNNRFSIISKEKLKQRILKHMTSTPKGRWFAASKAMAESKPGEFYPSTLWECLTLELACEGRIVVSEMSFTPGPAELHPLNHLTNPYILNGFDLRKLYGLKCFKPRLRHNYIIKNPYLTELQLDILNILYDFATKTECVNYVQTEKVVMAYYANYADTSDGEPINKLIDTIYAMAQPWRIKTPLLIARGYMGTPEQCDYEYSGAADMFYTEVSLSSYGKEVIHSYLNKKQR